MLEMRSNNDKIQKNNTDEILLILTVDIYYDIEYTNSYNLHNIDLLEKISLIINEIINNSKITWLLSDDEKIIKKFLSLKNRIIRKNDEIGLHCLISKFHNIEESKIEDLDNYIRKSVKLLESYKVFPKSIRIAGCASSNNLLSALAKHKILIDSSALPNRKRVIPIKFNWEITDSVPYYPSKDDYRIPNEDMTKCHEILELPITTLLTQTKYDKEPYLRYFDLTFHTNVIKNQIDKIINSENIIVAIIHPMQILEMKNKNELYCDSLEEFKNTLKLFVETCNKHGKKIKCVTMSECKNYFKTNNFNY